MVKGGHVTIMCTCVYVRWCCLYVHVYQSVVGVVIFSLSF